MRHRFLGLGFIGFRPPKFLEVRLFRIMKRGYKSVQSEIREVGPEIRIVCGFWAVTMRALRQRSRISLGNQQPSPSFQDFSDSG